MLSKIIFFTICTGLFGTINTSDHKPANWETVAPEVTYLSRGISPLPLELQRDLTTLASWTNDRLVKKLSIEQSTIPGAGLGCFVKEDADFQAIIGIYTGTPCSSEHSGEYVASTQQNGGVDAKTVGNETRFINHRRNPEYSPESPETISDWKNRANIALIGLESPTGSVIPIFLAMRKICSGEELFFDYGPDYPKPWEK